MARRVGLPTPSTSPLGAGGGSFGQYDVLSTDRADGLAFQRAQARWSAGRISNAEYLRAWQAYIATLDPGTTTYVNAVDGLRQQRYVFARDDIVTRIEDGEERAWRDLLEFDLRALDGMVRDNAEYRARQDRLRQTQNGLFQIEYNDVKRRVDNRQMTLRQMREWYRGWLHSDVTRGNPDLIDTIRTSIRDLGTAIEAEARNEVLQRWRDEKMAPLDFIAYAQTQIAVLPDGSDEEKAWRGYIQQARLQSRTQSLTYRWNLSQRWREIQLMLVEPPKGARGATTRTVWKQGVGWVDVPVEEAPTPGDVAAFEQHKREVALLRDEATRIQSRIAATGEGFVDPTEMLRFYQRQLERYAPGTSSHMQVQAQIDKFEDLVAMWQAQDQAAGQILVTPSVPEAPATTIRTPGGRSDAKVRPLAGEKGMTLDRFMRAVASVESGGDYRAVNAESGARGRYQIMPSNWGSWATTYLGDPNAKWTPENQDAVARGKIADLYKWLGSWALVAYWWLTGDGHTRQTGRWSSTARWYVDAVMSRAGAGPLPATWDFRYTVPRDPRDPPPPGAYTGTPRDGWGGRTDIGGGANLTDASAGASAYGVALNDPNASWNDVVRALKNGKGMVAQGLASVFQGTGIASERWDPNFVGKGIDSGHSVMLWGFRNGKILWLDPLAPDGDRGEWVDASIVRRYLTAYSGGADRVSVAFSPRAIGTPPVVVSEREPGPWTGCTWASTAMLINGIRGRRVATMQDVRAYGESGQYQPSDVFAPGRGSAPSANPSGRPRQVDRNGGRTPFTVTGVSGGSPVVPGPQPRSATGDLPGGAPLTEGAGWEWPVATTTPGPQGGVAPATTPPVPTAATSKPDFYTVTMRSVAPRDGVPMPGVETIRGGRFPNGMVPADFQSFYGGARDAFLAGDTTFTLRDSTGKRVTYYFPPDPWARRTYMEQLDSQRIDLTQHQWRRVANDPTHDPEDEARRRSAADGAIRDAAQNAFDMLFLAQSGPEDPTRPNVNPGDDARRLAAATQAQVQAHIDLAQKRLAAGDETGAYAEIQAAQQLVDDMEKPMSQLIGQVKGVVKEWGKTPAEGGAGEKPDEGTRDDIAEITDWIGSSGIDALIGEGSDGAEVIKEVSGFVQLDQNGDPVVNPLDGQFVLRRGIHRVIKPSGTAGQDATVDYVAVPERYEPDANGQMRLTSELEEHVGVKVFTNGRWVLAQAPYTVGYVATIVDTAGNRFPILGKMVQFQMGGLAQNQVEQPLAPGRWSSTPPVYVAPGPITSVKDDQGNESLSWIGKDAQNRDVKYSLSFNGDTASYEVWAAQDDGQLVEGWLEPVIEGNLAGNLNLQATIGFTRDLAGLDDAGRFGADLDGPTMGMSDATLLSDHFAALERQNAKARLDASMQQRINLFRGSGFDIATGVGSTSATSTPSVFPAPGGQSPLAGSTAYRNPVTPTRPATTSTVPTQPAGSTAYRNPVTPTRPVPAPSSSQPRTPSGGGGGTVRTRPPRRGGGGGGGSRNPVVPPAPRPKPPRKPRDPDENEVIIPRPPIGGGPVIS